MLFVKQLKAKLNLNFSKNKLKKSKMPGLHKLALVSRFFCRAYSILEDDHYLAFIPILNSLKSSDFNWHNIELDGVGPVDNRPASD